MKLRPHFSFVFLLPIALLSMGLGYSACHSPENEQKVQRFRQFANDYLIKDSSIVSQFNISSEGIAFMGITDGKIDQSPQALIYWDEIELFKKMLYAIPTDSMVNIFKSKGRDRWKESNFANLPLPVEPFKPNWESDKPLKGLRVALDPGHIGGTMEFAEMEMKFIKILPNEENAFPQEISFNEGNLALGTSILLAQRLRAQGAEVLLTREKEGMTAFDGSFEEWLQAEQKRHEAYIKSLNRLIPKDKADADWAIRCAANNYVRDYEITGKSADWWINKADIAAVYRIPFLKAEFLERAKKINAFRPHLTFVIHFNVHESNEPKSDGYRGTTQDNYCMAFVPGSFMAGELKTTEDRLAFAAKLLTDDILQSQSLCAEVIAAHEKQLNIPAIEWDENLRYLREASLKTPEKGVFARNLQLTRLINGTLCFGESLYQDNIEECQKLNGKDFILPGMTSPLPNRISEVAAAYFDGMINWLKTSN